MSKFYKVLENVIKLKGFGGASNTDARQVIEILEDQGQSHPTNSKQFILDGVILELDALHGKLYLKYIGAIKQGRRNGTFVMEQIIDECSQLDVDIILHPTSVSNTSQEQLVAWYKRFGFEEYKDDFLILYV